MQENTVMLETLTVEENDLVSFSIVDLMEKETRSVSSIVSLSIIIVLSCICLNWFEFV